MPSSSVVGTTGSPVRTYLARAGRSVLVLEAAERLGGAATTREFAPGFKVSAGAHLLHLMPPALLRELNLAAPWLQAGRRAAADRGAVEPGAAPDARPPGRAAVGRRRARLRRMAAAADENLRRAAPGVQRTAATPWHRCLERSQGAPGPGLAHAPPRPAGHARTAADRAHERARPARGSLRESAAEGCARSGCRARHQLRAALPGQRAVAAVPPRRQQRR